MARTYGGKTGDERRAERRARVLDAALDLYGTKGFHATSINDLCAAAHVTTRHFYEEFESAEHVLLALYNQITAESTDAVVAAVLDTPLDARSRARAGMRAFLETILGDERKGRIVGIEVAAGGDLLEEQRRQNRHVFADFLASQARELNPDAAANPAATWRMALVLVGGLGETLVYQMYTANPTPVETLVDEIATIFETVATLGPSLTDDSPADAPDGAITARDDSTDRSGTGREAQHTAR